MSEGNGNGKNGNGHGAVAQTTKSRVSLSSIVRQRSQRPMRILLHGTEGVGKTTFAAGAPSPIFIGPEDGIPPALGDLAHFPVPEGGWTWPDVLDATRELITGEHPFQTVVFDTLDWLEPLLWKWVCERNKVDSIETVGGGYGKGYVVATDGWRVLLSALERLRAQKGMHVIFLAHSWIKAFKDPTSEGYDRYELKIHKQAAGLCKEWCDAVLFARYDDTTTKDARTKRVRGISTGSRIIYTSHHAAYDAKNRYDLPEELPLSWDDFYQAVQQRMPANPTALRNVIEENIPRLGDEGRIAKARAAIKRAGDDAVKLAQLNDWVNGWLHSAEASTNEEVA